MDEAEDSATILLAKEPMIVCQATTEVRHLLDECVAFLIIVVQMNFNIANAELHHFCDAIEQFAPVLFLGIKETVLGPLSRGVARSIICDAGPSVTPPADTANCRL
jgi:hypothetical protein